MESKHTPGPWQVNGVRHSGDLTIGPNARLHFVGPDDDPVAAVFFDMKTGKGFADAHLIAQAPTLKAQRDELLAACKALVNAVGPNPSFTVDQADRMARVAIARAEGR